MYSIKFVLRDLSRSRNQAAIFVLCVVVSIVTLVAVNGFSRNISDSLWGDARALHAGDIIIKSRQDFSEPLIAEVEALKQGGHVASARFYEFYSVVRAEDRKASLLSKLKVVQKGYPFYGRCDLASGRSLSQVLTGGKVVVANSLLDRLGLQIGDRLHIGSATLVIADVIIKEPDRPVSFYSLGPRIFVAAQDLETLDLLKKGSRIRYVNLLKVLDEFDLEKIAAQLTAVADPVQERVETFKTAESGVKRFFNNFLFFLNLIGIFTLFLAGIGIFSALTAYLREKEKTIAIVKTVGGTSRFIFLHYTAGLLLMALFGSVIGILLGFALQYVLPLAVGDLLPQQMKMTVSWIEVVKGLGLGMVVVGLFAFLPLYRLKDIKPASIFRKASRPKPTGLVYHATIASVAAFFVLMVLWQFQELKSSLYLTGGGVFFFVIITVVTHAVFLMIKRLKINRLSVRQALKGLSRPGNATRPIIITLSASLTLIFSIYLVERNLSATFVESYPPDTPNLFFVDIQPDQLNAFDRALNMKTRYFPVVRARIVSINGEKIDRSIERQKRGDNLSRTFNLTYRSDLLEDETIVSGKSLFKQGVEGTQVSVMDTVAKRKQMKIGDRIVFRIQGVPLEAVISSVRSRTRETMKPFFYFVFEKTALKQVPQTIFTAVKIEEKRIPEIQNRIVTLFPNVSVIDLSATLRSFAEITRKLSNIIRFFTAFSILAGLLIIISAVFATRFARTRESVYYRVLGAKSTFVLKVFSLENIALGIVSAMMAFIFSQIISWIITTRVFDVEYQLFVFDGIMLIVVTVLLVVVVGLLPARSILKYKPVKFLREQTQE